MLSRATVRSCRIYNPPPFLRPRFLSHSSPLYAKNHRSPRPFEYKPPNQTVGNRHGPITQHLDDSDTNAAASTVPSASIDASQLEEEFRNIEEQMKDVRPTIPPESSPNLQNDTESSSFREDTSPLHSTPPSTTGASEAQQPVQSSDPSKPLPDLTQGIPSTIDAELDSSSRRADPTSLNITEDPASSGGKSGQLPKTAYISSLQRKRARVARIIYGLVFLQLAGVTVWYGRNWESEEQERSHPNAPSGWGLGLFYNRFRARLRDTLDYYNEPAFPKLLPDVDPTWERPYTLILSLEDLLVHSEWSRDHGWRMAKRPGVDYFLRYLSQYYELVIWTSNQSMIAQPIIQKLDPYRVVMWPLFREATRYQKGEYIKDLSYLNRDVKKILMVDTDPAHARLQPENAIILPKWKGDIHDKDLVSLIPFLEYCAAMNFDDLRAVLKSFEGKSIPAEYARREAVARQKYHKQLEEERGKRPKRSMGLLSSLTGGGSSRMVGPDGMELPTWSEGMEQGKTYQDHVREKGQKQYEVLENQIKENGEKWLKEMADEEKKLNEEAMKGMKKSLTSFFPFGGGGSGGGGGAGGGQGKPST